MSKHRIRMSDLQRIGAGVVCVMAVVAPLFYCMALFAGYLK